MVILKEILKTENDYYEPIRQQPTGGMYEGSHESGIPEHQRRDKVMGLFPV